MTTSTLTRPLQALKTPFLLAFTAKNRSEFEKEFEKKSLFGSDEKMQRMRKAEIVHWISILQEPHSYAHNIQDACTHLQNFHAVEAIPDLLNLLFRDNINWILRKDAIWALKSLTCNFALVAERLPDMKDARMRAELAEFLGNAGDLPNQPQILRAILKHLQTERNEAVIRELLSTIEKLSEKLVNE
ncbi:MAG: hypothetical protein ABIH99_04560 [Candidatus Micrarchaeota archaeon]